MGGSCSKYCTSIVTPTNVLFDEIPVSKHTSVIPKPTRILENCIVIWLFDDPSNQFENEKEQLRHLVYKLEVFTNSETCLDYIQAVHDEKLFLIIPVTYQSIADFYRLPQIEKVYIFDSSSYEDKLSLQTNLFQDINILCKQLQQDIELCELDLISFSFVSNSAHDMTSSMTLIKEDASFIYTQVSNEIIVRLKFERLAKDVFIEFCRIHYADNIEQLRIIEEFSNCYRPSAALDWLKRTCFISKILNRSKRTHEIDILYKLGFFIKQLNMQLLHMHEENLLATKNISVVYRGKTMVKEEFDILAKNNCNGLLSFSNFLVASNNKEKAMDFIRSRLALHPNMVAIMFEISIDQMIFNEDSPFALLKSNEICFSAGTAFRIESIEQVIDNSLILWLVKLKLIRDDDPQLQRLLVPFRTDDLHVNPISCLGKLLIHMGEYRRVEQLFLGMLSDPSIVNQPHRLVRVQTGLGTNYAHKGEYATALEHYEQALQAGLTYLPPDHSDLALMYKNIGDCYFKQNNNSYALKNYERAINMIDNSTQSQKSPVIDELRSLVNKITELVEFNK